MQGFLEYLYLYQMESVQIKYKVRGKSSSFWWCKRYSQIGSWLLRQVTWPFNWQPQLTIQNTNVANKVIANVFSRAFYR